MKRRPARVLHVINGRGIGGAESLLLALEPRLDRSIIRTSFANTFFRQGEFVDAVRAVSSDVRLFPASRAWQLPGMVTALARHISKGGFDVVHTHLLHSAIAGHASAALAGHGLVVTTRHYTAEAYVGKPAAVVAADRYVLRHAHHVVAVSEAVRSHVLDLGVRPERVSVIYNGIDVSLFDSPARAAKPALKIGTAGSLTWRKGHSILLDAFARMPEGTATLTIAGEGPERASLEAAIAAHGLGDSVFLAGFSTDVPRFLSELDVYVQPSLEEPFGISILEAMASRLPVVATRTGGIPEIVQDGISGILVPRGEAEPLAAALNRLAGDPEARARMGEEGRRVVLRDFDISAAARRYEELYLRLMESPEEAR